jgi:hypothetical protein
VLASVVYFASVLSTIGGVLLLGATQCAVCGVVAIYARQCRYERIAAGIVLAMALIIALLGVLILHTLTPPVGYGAAIFVMLFVYAQSAIAVVGCYFGYALVEHKRLKHYNLDGFSQGKLVVIAVLVAGALAIVTWSIMAN